MYFQNDIVILDKLPMRGLLQKKYTRSYTPGPWLQWILRGAVFTHSLLVINDPNAEDLAPVDFCQT